MEEKVAGHTGYKAQKRGRGKSEVRATRLFAGPHDACDLDRCVGVERIGAALCCLLWRNSIVGAMRMDCMGTLFAVLHDVCSTIYYDISASMTSIYWQHAISIGEFSDLSSLQVGVH